MYTIGLPFTVAGSVIVSYADDSSLYKTEKKHIQDVQINLQHNVDEVAKWCKRNNMSLETLIQPSQWSFVIRVDCL